MGKKAEDVETARLCRIQAALTTNPDVRRCLIRMAEHYEAEVAEESENPPRPPDITTRCGN